MRRLILIPLLFSASLMAQAPWNGVLNSTRAARWDQNAGLRSTLPTGETAANAYTPPPRLTICSTISSAATVATINSAMSSCPSGETVKLPCDKTITNTAATALLMGNQNGVTLRGCGADKTTIFMPGASSVNWEDQSGGSHSATMLAAPAQGATTIQLSSVAGITVGKQAITLQGSGFTTDNGGVWTCADPSVCSETGNTPGPLFQYENHIVTAISGTGPFTVTIFPAILFPAWSTLSSLQANWYTSSYADGLEDLTVDCSGNSTNACIYLSLSAESWIKGVRVINGNNNQMNAQTCTNCLVANDYFTQGPQFAEPINPNTAGNNLYINNIFNGAAAFVEGPGAGDVWIDNLSRDGLNVTGGYVNNTFSNHTPGYSDTLVEGNEIGDWQEDNVHGTSNLNTFYRNLLLSNDPPYVETNNVFALLLAGVARFENVVGNVMGETGSATYKCTPSGGTSPCVVIVGAGPTGITDTLSVNSAMFWGNYDTVTGAVRCNSSEVPTSLSGNAAPYVNSVPANCLSGLPLSFFFTNLVAGSSNTNLPFGKVCTNWSSGGCGGSFAHVPVPTVGPEVTGGDVDSTPGYANYAGHAYHNAAYYAWKSLPVDTSYQNTYAISSASWSGGKETLTFGGGVLPGGSVTINGPMQLSQAGICAFGPSNECQITNATSTTISFSLASNPGAITGTMKWPDFRAFNEGVYQADTSGGSCSVPYSTTFPGTENPLSEGGCWSVPSAHGAGSLWGDVQKNGYAFGVSEPTTFGDPTALLTTGWGATNEDVTATVKVTSAPTNCCHEAELRLMSNFVSSTSLNGYEINCSVVSGTTPYIQLVRWNGANGNFTQLDQLTPSRECRNGDILEATAVISGSTITFTLKVNTVLQAFTNCSCTNPHDSSGSAVLSGNPGIGFYDNVDSSWSNFGFSGFNAASSGGSTFSLTVTSANGTVTGTNCATGSYASGTSIGACTATPNSGYTFSGWSGTGSASGVSGIGTASFNIAANSTLTAAYTANSYTLSTATTGTGSGTITGCAGSHVFATSYSCTVTPAGGSTLASVSGCGGSGTTTYAGTMPASSCVVTATFNASAATPTFSPVAGTYGSTQAVSISSTTPTPTICFTIDGSTPTANGSGTCTHGTTYSTAITVSTSQTIKAVASKAIYNDSGVGTAAYVINGAAATPTFSPVAGAYAGAPSVTLTASSGPVICYNTTGSPATNGVAGCTVGTLYSAPVSVAVSETLFAVAGGTGFTDSSVGSAVYTINGAVATPTFSPAAGSYGPTQTVTISTGTAGTTLCYTTDGSTPTANGAGTCTHGTTYSTPVSVASSLTLKAVGSKSAFTDSAVGSAAYVINGAVATPTFSPVAGTYTGAQTVTISSSTSGASLFYTTDGSTPTTSSTPYTVPITVSASETVKALGTKGGFSNSAIGSAAYVITAPTTTAIISGKAVISGKAGVQ